MDPVLLIALSFFSLLSGDKIGWRRCWNQLWPDMQRLIADNKSLVAELERLKKVDGY